MDENQYQSWLNELDKTTALIVPTRSLASTLNTQASDYYISQAKLVWEAPNILTWSDYVNLLWQLNASELSSAHTLITNQQSLLLWTQIVEASRRQERALTLLDVQQTAKAAQRSWRLMNDWGVTQAALEQDHVEDIEQFLRWLSDYQRLLNKRGLIDEPLLIQALLKAAQIEYPFQRLIWHSYDLVTAAQTQLNDLATKQGVVMGIRSSANAGEPEVSTLEYQDSADEIRASLIKARALIEASDHDCTINVVIPDLQRQQEQVREIARDVFYPAASPIALQQMNTVYRFSLGQPLNAWSAVETALSVIKLLKNRTSVVDVGFLLRNQFLGLSREHAEECRLFERWLKRQRIRNLLLDNLPALYEQCLDFLAKRDRAPEQANLLPVLNEIVDLRKAFQLRLDQQKENNNFAAISFPEWVNVYDQWLQVWGWRTELKSGALDSVQYQLLTRWQRLLEEYASLSTVQSRLGLSRAIDVLQQMTRDAVFLPQAVASPILISGIYEAIGRPVNRCFLTGMNNNYPPVPKSDAFVPNRVLQHTGFPDATAQGSYSQASKVIKSLLASAESVVLSYALHDAQGSEIENHVSPLYRDLVFSPAAPLVTSEKPIVALELYQDSQGPAWASTYSPRGGSAIFENQSNCAFKAFVTHQLQFERDQEAEFGLDGLDRGNVVHRMLDIVWQQLQTQAKLNAMPETELDILINTVVEQAIVEQSAELSVDKIVLLGHERPRLSNLLKHWLALEAKRPLGFSVVEREKVRQGIIGGVEFTYIIDRLDQTDDGGRLIIDYKTGSVARRDWTEERLAKPQLPLYWAALSQSDPSPISGIAYAKVDSKKHEFVELCETGILRTDTNYAKNYEHEWHAGQARWPALFDELAKQFLAGDARVNPIEEKTCLYCELQSVCRVSQLRELVSEGDHD